MYTYIIKCFITCFKKFGHFNCPKNGIVLFCSAVLHPTDADGMANSANPDQTAPKEQSDLGLHCWLRSICPNTTAQNLKPLLMKMMKRFPVTQMKKWWEL